MPCQSKLMPEAGDALRHAEMTLTDAHLRSPKWDVDAYLLRVAERALGGPSMHAPSLKLEMQRAIDTVLVSTLEGATMPLSEWCAEGGRTALEVRILFNEAASVAERLETPSVR